jgi:hypothetical protein
VAACQDSERDAGRASLAIESKNASPSWNIAENQRDLLAAPLRSLLKMAGILRTNLRITQAVWMPGRSWVHRLERPSAVGKREASTLTPSVTRIGAWMLRARSDRIMWMSLVS